MYRQVKFNSFFSRLHTFQFRSLLRQQEFLHFYKNTAIDEFGDKENNFSTSPFKFLFLYNMFFSRNYGNLKFEMTFGYRYFYLA